LYVVHSENITFSGGMITVGKWDISNYSRPIVRKFTCVLPSGNLFEVRWFATSLVKSREKLRIEGYLFWQRNM